MFCATALGQATISYELELGGDNSVADWEWPDEWPIHSYKNTAFTAGDPADHDDPGGLVLDYDALPATGTVITWDAVVRVTGLQSGSADPPTFPADIESNGATNLVFTIELRSGDDFEQPGSLPDAGDVVFHSTINDGDADGFRGSDQGTDPLEMAALCNVFDVGGNGPHPAPHVAPNPTLGKGPGRASDESTSGGPEMNRVQFPTIGTHGGGRLASGSYTAGDAPVGGLSDAQLLGMGCGYPQFNPLMNGGAHTAGIGIDPAAYGAVCYRGLGHLPIFEGQIDVASLGNGVYTLTLSAAPDDPIPVVGNNIMPGSYDCWYGGATAFSDPADVVEGDTITFEIRNKVEGVNTVAWRSMATHLNSVGELGVPLDATDGVATTEPRKDGVTVIEVDFSDPVTDFTAGQVVITGDPGLSVVTDSMLDADTMRIELTGTTDMSCYLIDISGSLTVLNDATCHVATLNGDSFDSKIVDVLDRADVKVSELVADPASAFPRRDPDLSGIIDVLDRAHIKPLENAGNSVTCP